MTFEQSVSASLAVTADPNVDGETTAHTVARACFDEANGDIKRAAKLMEEKLRGDKVLLAQLIEQFIHLVCQVVINHIMRTERTNTWLAPNYEPGGYGNRVHKLAESNVQIGLMKFWLGAVGKVLGDCNAEEVSAAAETWHKQGSTMVRKAKWLFSVAKVVQKGKTVAQSLTEKKLRELQQKAANA